MPTELVSSDSTILDLLRRRQSLTVAELSELLQVTATAVRQRLVRMMAQGFIERQTSRERRGRPSHRYRLTTAGKQKTGTNFTDLAITLWEEIRLIDDVQVRRGLLTRIARRMAQTYAEQIQGATVADKMTSLAQIFEQRQIPFDVDTAQELPVLTALACPYPVLAEQDRSVCAMEKMMFEEMLGEKMHLSQCRLDGSSCCTFELSASTH